MEGKTDTQNTSPIKFRPMPKRFIVWTGKDFYRERDKKSPSGPNSKIDGKIKVFELRTLSILAHFPNIKVKAVCQCTGLLDCKAQFIYEGSILRLKSGHIGYVYFNKELAEFLLSGQELASADPLFAIASTSEVIGHILSNPELQETAQ